MFAISFAWRAGAKTARWLDDATFRAAEGRLAGGGR
jgi:hypothetical protein